MQLWKSRQRYDDRFKPSTWIYRIALNVAISWYRRQRKHVEKRVPIEGELISCDETEREETDENPGVLQECIAELEPLNRALVLLFLDGNDHQTTAEILGITATNVATRLNRIKKQLRGAFEARRTSERITIDGTE